ncbi:MAG: pirin family protein [Mycobacteriales bacterium]
MPSDVPGIRVLRSADRFVTRGLGTVSRHCFSFGEHYDSDNVAFGNLVAVNEESLANGAEFAEHRHAGVDIVTWVAQGRVEHSDSAGRIGLTQPGVVRMIGSGSGVRHRERNAGEGACRFVQSWLAADASAPPTYEQVDVSGDLARGGVVLLLERAGSSMYGGVLGPGVIADMPADDLIHVFVVLGSVSLDGFGVLEQGDSARIAFVRQPAVTAGGLGAELLVWGLAAP